ncbi:MAG: hypothetical protein AAF085_16495, partial [Planctomycetota bacterium]
MKVNLNLVVIYSEKREQLRNELSAFGLVFKEHQHGSGPIHDACEMDDLCLEIYPASANNLPTHTRLGLTVLDISMALKEANRIGAETKLAPKESPWGIRAVIQLQSGIKLEL